MKKCPIAKLIKKQFVIICVVFDLVFFYMFVVFFLFLGSNFNQQTNDEENPETHQLLLQTDKENDREGVYISGRSEKDRNK